MGLWSRLTGKEERSAPTTWDALRMNAGADAAIPVSPVVAESLSAVYGAVRLVSEGISALPLLVYRRLPDGRVEAPEHPVARLFGGQINEYQTASEFVETIQASALLNGAGYAEIVRNGNGQPTELRPLAFGLVSPVMLPSGRRAYDVSDASGGSTRRLLPSEIFAIFDRTDDGVTVRSRLARTRETIANAIAAERFAGSFFGNGAALSGVLKMPTRLSTEAHARLRSTFEQAFTGTQKAGRVAILEEGLDWSAVSATPDKSQALESRRLSVEAVARIMGVPPVLLGDLSHANFANSVELNRQFLTYGLMPWLNKWERRIEFSLFSEIGRQQYEVEFDADLLLRADMLTRFQAYRIAREVGLYSANELRAFEKQNPRADAGGEDYFAPRNMQAEQKGGIKDREPIVA